MMKPDIKEKWIAALSSGEYKKGERVLKTHDGKYCCLGVLCEVYRKETGQGDWSIENEFSIGGMGSDILLPRTVANWAGIDANPEFLVEGKPEYFKGHGLLTDVNDDFEGGDFSPMIEAIEKYF